MKKSTKFLILVVSVAFLGSVYATSSANSLGPTDCSVPDPAECSRVKIGENSYIITPGKPKPVQE